jgi:predicted alpha/beta-fold hydrolase
MRDGGYVQLDWAEEPGSMPTTPVLIVLHGIGIAPNNAMLPTMLC